jgi:hypothetical protein
MSVDSRRIFRVYAIPVTVFAALALSSAIAKSSGYWQAYLLLPLLTATAIVWVVCNPGAERQDRAIAADLLRLPDTALSPIGRDQSRWVGGLTARGKMGGMNVSAPLADLVIRNSELVLRVRSRLLASATYFKPLRVDADDSVVVFPAKGQLGSSGVGVRVSGDAAYYFWCTHKSRMDILARAAEAGFAIEKIEQPMRLTTFPPGFGRRPTSR